MTLFEVRDLLKSSQAMTTAAVAHKGRISIPEAELMLEHWVRRGLAHEVAGGCHTGGLCKTCGACSSSQFRWFQWNETVSEEASPLPESSGGPAQTASARP